MKGVRQSCRSAAPGAIAADDDYYNACTELKEEEQDAKTESR